MIDPRIVEAFNKSHEFPLVDPNLPTQRCIMLCYVGSKSHNTYIPKTDPDSVDDVDMMGVIVPPPEYTIGLETFEHWTFKHEELDVVFYSLEKFIGLLVKSNPNVLGTLWMQDDHFIVTTPIWELIRLRKHVFATKAAFGAFAGYASGQLQRMTSYSPEIQAEIDQLEADLAAVGWKLQDIMDKRSLPMPKGLAPDRANEKAERLRHLRAKYHSAYMGEKRRKLVVQHGYDTKNAAHLVRLLRMCIEFLNTGTMNVWRTWDADEIKAIKQGALTLDQVKAMAEQLFEDAKVARDNSSLPENVEFKQASALLTRATRLAYGWVR
jgi:hypothetical protein